MYNRENFRLGGIRPARGEVEPVGPAQHGVPAVAAHHQHQDLGVRQLVIHVLRPQYQIYFMMQITAVLLADGLHCREQLPGRTKIGSSGKKYGSSMEEPKGRKHRLERL